MIRIVKLVFEESQIEGFLEVFEENKHQIRNFKGCNLLEVYRDKKDPCVFFTYSLWDEEEDLENYRKSDLFRSVWSQFKPKFKERAQAWSVDKIESLA